MNKNFAVIDTETTYSNEVMSIGIVISSFDNYDVLDKLYLVIYPIYLKPAMYTYQLNMSAGEEISVVSYEDAMFLINKLFEIYGVEMIFAYNARFDYMHLPELSSYYWFDIMKIAAYR